MTEEEMIRQIAEPILKQLEKIEKELGNHRMPQLPQIKFVKESEMGDGPFTNMVALGYEYDCAGLRI